ncbi:hypothetical protein [Crenobacter caeni]|uniref:hypothetical protein n=1 Tax=Crenobacter caeni TaxID=2705474 RepID=UPI003D7B170C
MYFGASSEACKAVQHQLFDSPAAKHRRSRGRAGTTAGRRRFASTAPTAQGRPPAAPDHLERIDVRHEPDSCQCGHR